VVANTRVASKTINMTEIFQGRTINPITTHLSIVLMCVWHQVIKINFILVFLILFFCSNIPVSISPILTFR